MTASGDGIRANASDFVAQADTFVTKANTFGAKADTLRANANTLGTNADTLIAKVDTFGAKADTLKANVPAFGAKANTSGAKADTFGAHANTLGAIMNTSGATMNTPKNTIDPSAPEPRDAVPPIVALHDRGRTSFARPSHRSPKAAIGGTKGMLLTAALPLLSVSSTFAQAQPAIDYAHCRAYEAVVGNMTWEQARVAATSRSFGGVAGHLATVTSVQESDFILAALGPRDSFALGGIQVGGPEPSGGWTWVTGEPWGYTNWNPGEPSNTLIHGQREDRLGTAVFPRWNDVAGDVNEGPNPGQYRMYGYFVEYELVGPPIAQQPISTSTCPSGPATFSVSAAGTGPFIYQWQWQEVGVPGVWTNLVEGPNTDAGGIVRFTATGALSQAVAVARDNHLQGAVDVIQSLRVILTNACGSVTSNSATLTICVADTDDGSGSGTCDGGVTIDDLLYYLLVFEQGLLAADVDDGTSTGTPDGGVTIDDLLYYLFRFEAGC